MTDITELAQKMKAAANCVVNQQDIELQELRQRITELESRTVTVKLPALRNVEMASDYAHNNAVADCGVAIEEALSEAGITVVVMVGE